MILRCENCQTMYMFTEGQLKSQGYRFACKKCGHENIVALPSEAGSQEQHEQPVGPESHLPESSPQQETPAEKIPENIPENLPKHFFEEPVKEETSAEQPEQKPQKPLKSEQGKEKTELEDIFASFDSSKTIEQPSSPEDKAGAVTDSGSGSASKTAEEFVSPPEEKPPDKDEEIIEGFEEFTMEDLQDSGQAEETSHEKETVTDTSWLESTKIEEHAHAESPAGTSELSEETIPMEEAVPEVSEGIAGTGTEAGVKTEAEESLLSEESISIQEAAAAAGQIERQASPAYQKHLVRLIIISALGIVLVLAALVGVYYYLVEYNARNPDFSKLAYMTYSVFPVSARAKNQAQQLLSEADSSYMKDTIQDYRESLKLYEQALTFDHHLTGAYVGIARDYAVLIDRNNTKEQLKNSAKFLSRLKVLLKNDARYNLVNGMIALANNNDSLASDEINTALQKSPQFPEAMYYRAYMDFIQGKPLTDTASVLQQTIKLSPDMIKAQLLLARVYQRQQEPAMAVEVLDNILGRYPYNASAAILEADIQAVSISGTAQSISRLSDILSNGGKEIDDYDKARLYYTIGMLNLLGNDYVAAIAAFKNSLSSSASAKTLVALGDAYMKKGNLNDAEKQYQMAISADNTDAEADFKLAGAYYLDHKYVLAISNYTAGLKLKKDDPDALYGLALAREKNGELDSALNVIESAVKLSEDVPEFIVLNGRLLREKGNYKDADILLSKAVDRFPDYAPLHTEYGVVLGKEGDYKNAIKQLTTAMGISPDTPENSAYMADMLNNTSKYAEAEKYALKALSYNKNFPYAHEVLGDIYMNEHRLHDAVHAYNTAISLQPYSAGVMYKLAKAYVAGKAFTSAASSLDDAIRIDPSNAVYHYTLGNVYRDMGNIQLAIGEYTRAINMNSTMADAYYQRGIMNISGRNDLSAINDLKNAMKYAPDNPDYMLALADYYYNNKETYSAIDYLNKALNISPKSPELHYKLGVAYNYIGKSEDAKKEFSAALGLSPHYSEAMIGLGNIYYQNGDIQRAQQYYEKAVQLSPDEGDAYYALGTVYEYNGMYEKALTEYRYAAKYSKNPASAYFKIGMMLANLNEQNEAKAALSKAINLGLPSDMEGTARNKLRSLM